MRDKLKNNWKAVLFGMVFVITGLVSAYVIAGEMILSYLFSADSSYKPVAFRWKSVLISFMFLCSFCGLGCFIIWGSLRTELSREERLSHERLNGIPSDQKIAHWAIAGFGSLIFVIGVGFAAVIPEAIRDGKYAAWGLLVVPAIGIAYFGYAVKSYLSYRKFGPTPLSLDPLAPCLGGQLGGSFEIKLPKQIFQSASFAKLPSAKAELECSKLKVVRHKTYRSRHWHEETDVYLQQTANGYQGEVIFEIPEDVPATSQQFDEITFQWHLKIIGDFGPEVGEFKREWIVDISEETEAGKINSSITIPESFKKNSEEAASNRAKTSALTQIPLTEDSDYINLISHAARHVGSKLIGILFGCIFLAFGILTVMHGKGLGYLFILIGALIVFLKIYQLGKTIEVKIDKRTAILYTRESWLGMVYSYSEIQIHDASKIKIKNTFSTQTEDKLTEYYVLYYKAESKTIRLADAIEGKKAAKALKQAIIERLDANQDTTKAA